jgi:hypothetical protein
MPFQQYPIKGGIPSGTTAQRPTSPTIGDQYYDGTLGFLLIWDGTKWLPCSAPAAQPTISVTDIGTNIAYGTVQASVTFAEGTSGGKAAGFTAIQGSNSSTQTSSPITLTISGNPGSYTFTGTAYNGFGTSPQATSVALNLTSVPQAPTIGTASISSTTTDVTVTWTLNATGGKNLSAITITPYLNGTTAQTAQTASTTSSTSYTFTGASALTSGNSYTFKIKTTNANGDSLESSASNSITVPTIFSIDYLVVAGGGGGGQTASPDYARGGGGAGGMRCTVTGTGGGGSLESALTIASAINYTVTVGAGGSQAANGSNSVFSSITSTGGGTGGYQNSLTIGANGGSGGGSSGSHQDVTGGSGTANQGYGGGGGNSAGNTGAGGGGGASQAGQSGGTVTGGAGNQKGGYGGAGVATSITGSSVTYAGGGGGGAGYTNTNAGTSAGAGGAGGGGAGNYTSGGNGTAGTANTGGGGGGCCGGSNQTSGAGGSGVVILRYPDTRTITIGAGLTGTTSAASGGYKRTTLTAGTGNVSWS